MKVIVLFFMLTLSLCAEKKIKVFVSLCDNKTQGIAKVGEVIGDGDKPDANLYWGCSDGLQKYFKKSAKWKFVEEKKQVSQQVLRRISFTHVSTKSVLEADAYRGSEMEQCLLDYDKTLLSGDYDLVVFIGHNPLMDFRRQLQNQKASKPVDSIVLCCISHSYFTEDLKSLGVTPVLMTKSLMYPGSFILHDAVEVWLKDRKNLSGIRTAAAKAYAKNQKISLNGGYSIFQKLE